MGGCVGKSKDLNTEDAPVEAPPAPLAPENNVEAVETVPEEKKEEPLVDLSEPPKAEEAEAEAKPVEEAPVPKEEEAKKVAETA